MEASPYGRNHRSLPDLPRGLHKKERTGKERMNTSKGSEVSPGRIDKQVEVEKTATEMAGMSRLETGDVHG